MWVAISNSGENICVTLEEFAKQYLLGDGERVAVDYHPSLCTIVLRKKADGRKVIRQGTGWYTSAKSSVLPHWPAHGRLWFREEEIDSSKEGVLLIKLPPELPPAIFKGGYRKHVQERVTGNPVVAVPQRAPRQLCLQLLGFTITITRRVR